MPPNFQDTVDSYYTNLYRFALSLSRSSDDAWDLTQETFLIWAKKYKSIRSIEATKSWLYTTLYREYIKNSKRKSKFSDIETAAPQIDESYTEDHDRTNEARNVMAELMKLKDVYRRVLSLYYLESYSYKEIAKILGVPMGTVMSRLARGKDMLRANMLKAMSSEERKVVDFKQHKERSKYGY
ncbi:RNA polymerase sigma factor [Puniceicoccaceae bacterium K14]|nr:RNA polymerase sigma factor [Puniceicoccaceae bacterium K14]